LAGDCVAVLVCGTVERLGTSVKLLLQSIVPLHDLPVLLGLCTSGDVPKLVSATFDPSGLENIGIPPRDVRSALKSPSVDDEWFRGVEVNVISFKSVPVYLGCSNCLEAKQQHRVDQYSLRCPSCGVLELKDIVACSHSVIDCEIDGVYADNIYCCANQFMALFSKSEADVMVENLSDEESCVGKTLIGTFLLSSTKRMLMSLERVVESQ
jgi:hypothetical protein